MYPHPLSPLIITCTCIPNVNEDSSYCCCWSILFPLVLLIFWWLRRLVTDGRGLEVVSLVGVNPALRAIWSWRATAVSDSWWTYDNIHVQWCLHMYSIMYTSTCTVCACTMYMYYTMYFFRLSVIYCYFNEWGNDDSVCFCIVLLTFVEVVLLLLYLFEAAAIHVHVHVL